MSRKNSLYNRMWGWYLDGPRCFLLRPRGYRYRSPVVMAFWWAAGWLLRLFCFPVVIFLPIALVFFLHSFLVPQTNVSVLSLVLLALFFTDLAVGIIFWPRLSLQRKLPERARAGQPFGIDYIVKNRGRLPVLQLTLDHELPMRWLKSLDNPVIGYLGGHGETAFRATVVVKQRGMYFMKRLSGSSQFPFGVLRRNSIHSSQDTLIVHPAFTPLEELTPPMGRNYQKGGQEKFIQSSDAWDFHGCREFRDGDNPKHIHWASSARRGTLVTKVFQDEYLSRTALILDTCVRNASRQSLKFWTSGGGAMKSRFGEVFGGYFEDLEAGVSLTAAIAHKLLDGECLVDIFAAGRQVRRLEAGRHLAAFNTVLDLLASIEPETSPTFMEMDAELRTEMRMLGSAVIILLGLDQQRLEFVQRLREQGLLLKVYLVGAYSDVPDGIVQISPRAILNGSVRQL